LKLVYFTECPKDKWGVECSQSCICVSTNDNTDYCNKANGTCHCKTGWIGNDCGTDVNECDNPNTCTGGKKCNNLPGTYECKCETGYQVNASDYCTGKYFVT